MPNPIDSRAREQQLCALLQRLHAASTARRGISLYICCFLFSYFFIFIVVTVIVVIVRGAYTHTHTAAPAGYRETGFVERALVYTAERVQWCVRAVCGVYTTRRSARAYMYIDPGDEEDRRRRRRGSPAAAAAVVTISTTSLTTTRRRRRIITRHRCYNNNNKRTGESRARGHKPGRRDNRQVGISLDAEATTRRLGLI